MRRKSSQSSSTAQCELNFEFPGQIDDEIAVVDAPSEPRIEEVTQPAIVLGEISGPCVIYTDGGCDPNPGRGGWAAIVIGANGVEIEMAGTVENSTNNRMEIWAALQALQSLPSGVDALIHTDSQYLQKGATEWLKGWKRRGWVNSAKQPVANQDLWQLIDAEIGLRKVTWKWVRGHADNAYNNRCDVLANMAAKGKTVVTAPLAVAAT
jgi:ribonuclease HI